MNSLTEILKPFIMAIFVIMINSLYAQTYHTSSQKAIRYFEKAKHDFINENYDKSIANVNAALKNDADFTDAYLLKAELYLELNADSLAIESYEKIFEIDSMSFPKSAISLSKLYSKYFQFDKSIKLLNWYLSLENQNENLRKQAGKQYLLTNFRKSLVENPVDYNPQNIGNVVNTSADEYINQFYVNENRIIFTKRYKSDLVEENFFEENVFVANKYESAWTIPKLLIDNIDDIGAANISSDGNEIYFSACGWENGLGSCDIYCVKFNSGKWSNPVNIKSVNTAEWESQPCLSYDGKELFFVRKNRKSGTSDIFVSKRDDEGIWMKPEPIGSNINTEGNEMAPFVHHDGKSLYFSSDTHPGMGGYDLFMSHCDASGKWSEPINLGYPLNTSGDEINLVVSNDAKKAFISAVRDDGYGCYDIYEFDLDERLRPEIIEFEQKKDEEYYADVLKKQESVVLKNIYFEFDSDELLHDSEDGINTIYNFLCLNPDKIILIEGHTDDIGDETYNIDLSERRAESIKKALINKGVSPDRIKTKGCGSSQPLFPNNFDDELKKLNRRVSMSFID